jgi:hypothetical protein
MKKTNKHQALSNDLIPCFIIRDGGSGKDMKRIPVKRAQIAHRIVTPHP